MDINTSAIATAQQQEAMASTEERAVAREEKVEELAQGEGGSLVRVCPLPHGRDSIAGFLADQVKNIRAMNRSLHTDTNLLNGPAHADRAREMLPKVIREGNVDSRVYIKSGYNTQVAEWTPAQPAPQPAPERYEVEPAWFLAKPGKRGGIKLEQSASMASLMPLVRGADAGPLMSAARGDVNVFSMNAVLGAMLGGSFNADHCMSSCVEPLLRILLRTLQTQDRGTSPYSSVGGMSSRVFNPLGIHPLGGYFPGGPNRPVWGVNDTVARVVNLEDFMREARGDNRFEAGWGPPFWGGTGMGGVAVVPIRQIQSENGAWNSHWTMAHLEYPVRVTAMDVDLIYTVGERVGRVQAQREYTNTSVTHVPGPFAKVLFVIVDQTGSNCGQVRLISEGVNLVADPELHYVIPTPGAPQPMVDLGIGQIIVREARLNADDTAQAGIVTLQQWARAYGNEDDWNSAWDLVSAAFTTYLPQFRRHGEEVEGARYRTWFAPPQQPFPLGNMRGWRDTTGDTRAQRVQMRMEDNTMLEASWGGYRTRGVRPQGTGNWLYIRFDPTVAVGMAARMWIPSRALTSPIPDRAAAVGDMAWGKGKVQCISEDIAFGQVGAPEAITRAAYVHENQGLAGAIIKRVTGKENEAMNVDGWATTEVAINGFYTPGCAIFAGRFPLSAEGTIRKRVCWAECREFGVDVDLQDQDLYSVTTKGGYLALQTTVGAQGGIWDLVRYPLPIPGEEAVEVMNVMGCMGGWTRAQTSVANLATIRENGVEGEHPGIVMSLPTESTCVRSRLMLFGVPQMAAQNREVPYGGHQRSMTTTNHKVEAAFQGARPLVMGSKGEQNPVFVNRTKGQPTLGAPTTDSAGMLTSDFLDI